MSTQDDIRKALHPEAHERLGASGFQTAVRSMEYDPRPRPVGPGQPPLGCDQQGRYPQAAEPCIDLDELGVTVPPPEPWWPYILGGACALLALALIFAPLGVK